MCPSISSNSSYIGKVDLSVFIRLMLFLLNVATLLDVYSESKFPSTFSLNIVLLCQDGEVIYPLKSMSDSLIRFMLPIAGLLYESIL